MATAKLLQQKRIAADVVLTDYHTHVLNNLRHNVEENFSAPALLDKPEEIVSVTVEALDWLEMHEKMQQGALDPDQRRYDLLLLADVIYAPEHALWIRSSIEALLRQPDTDDESGFAPRAHIIMLSEALASLRDC